MDGSKDFFTLSSLATFGGITIAVTIIANTVRSLTNKDPKHVAFVASVVICFSVAWPESVRFMDFVVTFLNGCLVYCSSMGLNNQMTIATASSQSEQTRGLRSDRLLDITNHFFKQW